ncbi:6-aminohexanoate hydrolase [Rhizobium sp. AC44/96]|uniref:serine hydrolase domain-containing protein n=1 Tax=Rhizobium sp. AC44/96 TaxID=1841654 RepID=UPI00080FE9F2|nr:serine hydrolase [Rhizobium sp. AC44/96]OCJ05118.1 6-aminohexanoate hydrolase [Rhizobium sp. AC44/96]
MRLLRRILKTLAVVAVSAIVVGAAWLFVTLSDLLKVGDGYAAKIMCSNVFIAGRDPDTILSKDVQAPGNPLLKLVRVDVDHEQKRVTARILGWLAPNYAVYRGTFGCANVPDGDFEAARRSVPDEPRQPLAERHAPWPDGDDTADDGDPRIATLLTRPALTGEGMRAVVVVHDGRIVAETYGDGFGPTTPLIGWSMTKTVNAAILGRAVEEHRVGLDDANLLPQWAGDWRSKITVANLLAMESGLQFSEDYDIVSDVTRMLYLNTDQTQLPAGKLLKEADRGTFNYSSGTSVLLSRIWMDRVGNPQTAFDYPRQALFGPLGMSSAVFEADAHGTFAGGSYLYATARDWARFGQFLLMDGKWKEQQLLPEGFVAMMRTPTEASDGRYTAGQAWAKLPGAVTNAEAGLPSDTFWMEGHDGQSTAIVPSAKLVVVRMGLTPSSYKYTSQSLLKEILAVLPAGDQST